jgi:hypothetical protein
MPTLHSHTHCQVAQANAQTKTWQRVCLSNCTTDRQSGRKTEGQQLTLSGIDETPQIKRPGDGAF